MVYFIRTRKDVTVPNLQLIKKEFVPEYDQPENVNRNAGK